MWILECDGDLFGGRRKWLKPGQNYLFGRTKPDAGPDEQFYAITNKSVSRKHLIISVAPVPHGQGQSLYEKADVTITDESKLGTFLDGERFVNESRILSDKQHSIKLGSYDQVFRISWQPVVLTLNSSKKELPRLQGLRDKLEIFDIKTITNFLSLDTTHVVTAKRNVPQSLQALILGRHIVTEQFIHALLKSCTSSGFTDDGSAPLPSPLEEDVDTNWPDPLAFLPPPGKEPHPRPDSTFAPDAHRINVFEGFTFIFADESQFGSLSSVVMSGGAKAIKYDLRLGETRLEDFLHYVRDVAKQRGIADMSNNHTRNKVVVVRFQGKGSLEQVAIEFMQNMDSQLGIRSIGQNEFLDAILMNDASPLHRVLEDSSQPVHVSRQINAESDEEVSNTQSIKPLGQDTDGNEQSSIHAQEQSPKDDSKTIPAPLRARARRAVAESKFKGFDDFDPSQISRSNQRRESSAGMEEESHSRTGSNTLFVQEEASERSTRKRPRSNTSHDAADGGGDAYESLFPAASEMKRRKIGEGQLSHAGIGSNDADQTGKTNGTTKKPTRSAFKEVDVRAAARLHAEKLDKERAAGRKLSFEIGNGDEGNDDDEDYDEDISKLRNLAIEEEMEVLPRQYRTQRDEHVTTNSNWDDRWNGMKNFKKFRRSGERNAQEPQANRGRRVLVNLVEVKRKDFGIGDNYWLEPSSASTGRRDRSSATTFTQSQSQNRNRTETDRASARDPAPGGRIEGPRGEIGEEEEEILPEEVAGQPREERVANALAEQQGHNSPATGGVSKRPAPAASAESASAPKRPRRAAPGRQEVNLVENSDSDDDELKFRFRRRRG